MEGTIKRDDCFMGQGAAYDIERTIEYSVVPVHLIPVWLNIFSGGVGPSVLP